MRTELPMSQSPRLSLPYIAPQQAQKHVTANEAFRRLDALVQLSAVSAATAAQPGLPAEGDAYILPAGATGAAWGAMAEGAIAAYQDGAWVEIAPGAGWRAYAGDTGALLVYDGAAWADVSSAIKTLQNLDLFGVGTVADAANPFSAKLNKALWTALTAGEGGSGDLRYTLNKEDAANVLSLLLQDGFSARAEMGLIGDDDFVIKVSNDGSAFNEALRIDAASGRLGFGGTDPDASATVTIDGPLLVEQALSAPLQNRFQSDGSYQVFALDQYSSAATWHGAFFQSRRARGSLASPEAAASGDTVFTFDMFGHDGTTFQRMGQQTFSVGGAVSAGVVPGAFTMKLADAAGALNTVFSAKADGSFGIGTNNPTALLHVDGPIRCKAYTVAGAPDASSVGAGTMIYVSDESGGAVMAFSDGTDWRRVTDRAVIS